MSKILEIVRDSLDLRNLSPSILQKVPVLVKRAVLDLHNSKIFPPKSLEFTSLDKKEEYNYGGELEYNYYKLPADFSELDEFYVKGKKPYNYTYYENYIKFINESDVRNWFTITDLTTPEGELEKVVICNPFPDDTDFIRLKYFTDGTDINLDKISERYWEVIIQKVESFIGIRDERTIEAKVSEASSNWRNQQGNKGVNNTHTKIKPSFFGKW